MTSAAIRVLGTLEVDVDGQAIDLRRLEARMLLTLLWQPNSWVDHDALSQRIYFDAEARDTTSWRNHLRRSLGDAAPIIETRRGRGTRFNTSAPGVDITLDIARFRIGRSAGDEHLASGEYEQALAAYRDANGLWRGEIPYQELSDDVDCYARIAALRQERRGCQQALVRLTIDAGDFASVLPELRSMVDAEPTDQATIAQLMRASAAIGNPTMAGEYYDQLCQMLSERGEIPRMELVDLHGQILRDEVVRETRPRPPFGRDLTPLLGRADDVRRVTESLKTAQLVTLVGPPGVGKSRLARDITRRHTQAGQVFPVQLASCTDGSNVALLHHVADELGLEHRRGTAFADDLADRLAGPDTLLVLDNCEHLTESLIVMLAGLFARRDNVRVLTTSREPLAIPGEVLHPVNPLPVGDEASPGLATSLCRDRVLAAGGPDHNPAELVDVCRLLDGLPLAIELAAPSIASEGIAATVARFDSRLSAKSGFGRSDPRHASLTSAIGWSVERLNDDERDVLLAAAMFSTTVAADDVASLTGQAVETADASLMMLRSRSLIRPAREPGTYSLFETVRRFARREARLTGVAHVLSGRHAQRVCELAASADSLPPRLLAEASPALRWAITTDTEEGIHIIDGLCHELYRIELPAGLTEFLRQASREESRIGSIATELWMSTAFFAGEYSDLQRRAAHTLAQVSDLDEPHRLVRVHIVTAFSFALSGNYELAGSHALEAEQLAAEVVDPWSYAWAASIDAYQLRRNRRHDDAIKRAVQALDRFEPLQYPQGKAFPFYTIAMATYRGQGDASSALDLLSVGIRHAVAGSDRILEGTGELFRGQVRAEQGDLEAAAQSLRRALTCCLESPQWTLIVSSLEYAAVLLGLRGDGDQVTALALTSFTAMARWRYELATRSRAIPYLDPSVAAPLEALPDRPDPKFSTPDTLVATLTTAIGALG